MLKNNFSSSSCSLDGPACVGCSAFLLCKVHPSSLGRFTLGCVGDNSFSLAFVQENICHLGKKKRKIHHLGTKTQPFCITSNPEAHTADKPEWMQKGSWKRKSMSRIDIFVALDIWKSLGNSQTLNFPASSQLYLLSKIPHVV